MINDTTYCLNGILAVGNMVLSTPEDDFSLLVGQVCEINLKGIPEQKAETENETDSIHVDFAIFDYSDERENEIAAMFSQIYGIPKKFADCPLDDVIMCPDSLINIRDIDRDTLFKLLESEEYAESYCKSIFEQVKRQKKEQPATTKNLPIRDQLRQAKREVEKQEPATAGKKQEKETL